MEPTALPAVGILLTPEHLSGDRVHTADRGPNTSTVPGYLPYSLLANKFIFHIALNRPTFNLAYSAENNLQKTGGSLLSCKPKDR